MANEQLQSTIETLYERRRKRERMTRIGWIVAGVCALILLVCLMVPAFTMEHNKYDCGLEEHTHTAQCYTNEVVCGLPTEKAHVHTPSCYSKSGKLTCEKAEAGHIHLDPCYDKNGKLVCDKEETVHIHKASCFDSNGNNVCKNKDALHVHGDTCYKVVKSDTDKSSKESADEKDSKSTKEPVAYQLTCNEESVGHVHRDACYDDNGKLVCGKDEKIEIPHKHDESCYEKVLACGQEEHTHTDECLKEEVPATPAVDEEGNLIDGDAADNAEGDTVADENVDLVDESAEPDLTDKEIKEAEDQGLLYENDDIVVAFTVPDSIKDSIKLKVTETDNEVVPYTDQDLSQFVPKLEDEVVVENGEGDVEVANLEEANGESTDVADNTDASNNAAQNTTNTVASTEEEPVYKTNLHVEATLNGEPVEDIASLGITAKLQVKSQVISPILKGINYKNAAPEAKNNVGAEISVLQQPTAPVNAASLSELPDAQLDEVMVTSVKQAATTFDVVDSDSTVAVTGRANPKFTVQFWAVVEELAKEKKDASDKELTIINTDGKKLPVNGNKSLPTSNLILEDKGGYYEPRIAYNLHKMYTDEPENYYIEKPNAYYFNKLQENGNYAITEAWVMKECPEGADANAWQKAANEVDCSDIAKVAKYWNVYIYYDVANKTYSDGYKDQWGESSNYENYCKKVKSFAFTNRQDADPDKFIYIANNATIRLVNEVTKAVIDPQAAEFYDYDISNGRVHRAKPPENPDQYVYKTAGQTFNGNNLTDEVLNWAKGLSSWDGHLYAYTKEQGINSSGNYSGSGSKLAFGNVNTGTNLGKVTWSKNGSNELNKYNNNGYLGCTFGLVSGLSSDGKINYSSTINAPKLFNEGAATGKTAYTDKTLVFNRVGDTYTLKSVGGTGLDNLDKFKNPTNSSGTHTSIYTNNFWPMDYVSSFGTGTHDVKFGGTATYKGKAHEIRFGPITQKGSDYTFPESDDGLYHNSYFGMHFNVDFDLSKDYIGPLNYLFFGDDDLWVFLSKVGADGKTISDSKLVIDIGGVHSSVGESVNLWDYIKKGDEGRYRLSIFYTERGASGSTCFMNYTLPSVSNPSLEKQSTGSLEISKKVEGTIDHPDTEFSFKANLYDKDGNSLIDDYSYTRYYPVYEKVDGEDKFVEWKQYAFDENGKAIKQEDIGTTPTTTKDLLLHDGATFGLKAGEYIKITNLPVNTRFEIEEIDQDGTYITTSTVSPASNAVTVAGKDNGGKVISGNITTGKTTVLVEYINRHPYQLPDTGGMGVYWFWISGSVLICIGVGTIIWRRRRNAVSAR